MPCFHPLTRVDLAGAKRLDTGKDLGKIVSWIPYEDRNDPNLIYRDIPCQHCIGCRLDYSKRWADRLMLEHAAHPDDPMWFFTITYNDYSLPLKHTVKDGIDRYNVSLRENDMQNFWKLLRKRLDDPKRLDRLGLEQDHIRYWYAGEYGEKRFRPHYHAIVFGARLDDLVYDRRAKSGNPLYRSGTVDSAWSFQLKDEDGHYIKDDTGHRQLYTKGDILIAPATWETCAYTARYVTKKLYGFEKIFYDEVGIDPPFSHQSNKPGIAYDFYTDGVFDYSNIPLNGRKIPPPKYFERIYEREDLFNYQCYSAEKMYNVEQQKRQLLKKIELPYLQYLEVCENNLKNRTEIFQNRDNFT